MNRNRIVCLLLFSAIIAIGAMYILTTRGYFKTTANAQVHDFSSPTYVGASQCKTCHEDKFNSWNGTNHAHAVLLIQNYTGNFYSIGATNNLGGTPSRIYNETNFRNSCRNCHVTGGNNWDPINEGLSGSNRTWPERETDPSKFINIQCEVCHGPNTMSLSDKINYTAALCEQCHAPGTSHDSGHWKSAHAQSLPNLLNTGYASDSCLTCHSTQGSLGLNVTLNSANLTSISCVTCHDPHSDTYQGQLRYENSTQLCSQCHSQATVFDDSPHSKAGLECTSCHGQGTVLSHGTPAPTLNHTWAIYGTFYPYNQTEPMVCSNCHDQTWATAQLGVIQGLTDNLIGNVSQAIDDAKAAVTIANQTSGVDPAKISMAETLIDQAESNVTYVQNDMSRGFHNPEQSYSILNNAALLASDAESTALNARADALGTTITGLEGERTTLEAQVSGLQTQISSLNNQTSTLQSDIDDLQASMDSLQSTVNTSPYLYGGMGLAIGFVIGAVIIFVVRKRKP